MSEKLKVTVIGAGGEMGTRVSNNLAQNGEWVELFLCENSPNGVESIEARGLQVTKTEEAVNFAVAVSALTVTKIGAQQSLPTKAEINEFLEKI